MNEDDSVNKKKKEGNMLSSSSPFKTLANSQTPSGLPPEPPTRPIPKRQDTYDDVPDQQSPLSVLSAAPVMSDVIKELDGRSGTSKKSSDLGKSSNSNQKEEGRPTRFNASNLHQRPPAPLPANYCQQQRHSVLPVGHEKEEGHASGKIHQISKKPAPLPLVQSRQLPAQPHSPLKKLSSSSSPTSPFGKLVTDNIAEEVMPTEKSKPSDEQHGTQTQRKTKAAKGAGTRSKTPEGVTLNGGAPKSPVARPRNRPPPPPPPDAVTDSGRSTSNTSLSSSDYNASQPSNENQKPPPKLRPVPRPRQKPEQSSAGIDQNNCSAICESDRGALSPKVMSPNANKPSCGISRQPSITSKPSHPPPAIPDTSNKSGEKSSSGNQEKASAPATKPLGAHLALAGSKPKPLAKPPVSRKPKITPPSLQPDPALSQEINVILQLSNQGQEKVKEILSLTDARVMDNSQNNLVDVFGELQKISLEVLESSSSLTDALGPQARFRVRRTVTDLESRYSDMEVVMQTVGPDANAVDLERLGKAVHSFSGALDSICSSVRATAS